MTTKRSCVGPAQVRRRLLPGCSTVTTPGSTATPWRGRGTGRLALHHRPARHRRAPPLRVDRRVQPSADLPDRPAPDDPASAAILRLDVARLKAALDRLTDDQRDVVMVRYAAGLGNDETARILGKPVSAVKSLHHRAIGALRRAMDDAQAPAPDDGGVA